MHCCNSVYYVYTMSAEKSPSGQPKSRLVRVTVTDDVWADFKSIHSNRYASNVLGELVERDVAKGRRTLLSITPERLKSALEDAANTKRELELLIERLERQAASNSEAMPGARD